MRFLISIYALFLFHAVLAASPQSIIDSLKQEANVTQDDSSRVAIFRDISKQWRSINSDSSLFYAKKALSLANAISDEALIGSSIFSIAYQYYHDGNYYEAIDSSEVCKRHYLKSKQPEQIIHPQNLIGLCYWRLGQFNKAIEVYTEQLDIIEEYQIDRFKVATLGNLGLIFEATDNDEKAKEYYYESMKLAKEFDIPISVLLNANNLSIILRHQKDFDQSISLLHDARRIALQHEINNQKSRVFTNLGATYSQMRQWDSAAHYLQLAEEASKEHNQNSQLIKIYWHQGELHLLQGEFDNALLKTRKSLVHSFELERLEDIIYGYEQILDVHKSRSDWEKASVISDSLRFWTDSLYVVNKAKAYSEALAQHELQISELKNKVHQANIAKLEQRNRSILWGGVGLLSLLILSGLVLWTQRKRKALNQQLALEEKYVQKSLKAIENNKKELASQLHDDIGQSLILAKNALQNKGQTVQFVDDALNKVRAISRNEYPYTLEYLGLRSTIEALIDQVEGSTNLIFSEALENIPQYLNKQQSLHLYRILQECVNNTIKYAGASSIFIGIQIKGEFMEVTYQDNGESFDFYQQLSNERSIGLKQILDRTRVMNGELKSVPSLQESNKYVILIPLSDENQP